MSVRLMSWAFETNLDSTTKFVLVAIADHASDDGVCWIGVRKICDKTSLKVRAVQNACSKLEAIGLLTRQFRMKETGQTTNLWELHPPHQMRGGPAPDAGVLTIIEPSTPDTLSSKEYPSPRAQGPEPTPAQQQKQPSGQQQPSSNNPTPPSSARPPRPKKTAGLQGSPPSLEEWRAKAKELAPEWCWSAPADVDRGYFYYARMDWCSPKGGAPYRSLGGCIGTCASRWRTEHPADFVEARRRLAAEARQGGIATVKVPEVTPPPRPAFLAPAAPVSAASLFGGLPGFDAEGRPSAPAILEEAE